MKHKILVYGTLRPGLTETRLIPGKMYDLGSFPGIKLGSENDGNFFHVEEIEVDDQGLKRLDQYEGYRPDSPQGSLYLRVRTDCGCWIYEFNSDMDDRTVVPDGDWLKYVNRPSGSAAGLGNNARGLI